jgi:hypothetical protein
MTKTFGLLTVLIFLSTVHAMSSSGQDARAAVAIVSALTGTASLTMQGDHRTTTTQLFDRLSAGDVVEVARDGRLTIVFSSGTRYELSGTARVTLGTTSLASRVGPVRQLTALPPLPKLAPIAGSARAGPRSGAVRIRGATISRLYPDAGSATLADSTVLRFEPLPDASRYRVDVQIESGASVLQVETQSPTVSISPGILKAGARYYWDVRTLDRAGQAARGAAEFMTLDGETVRARAALKESIDAAGDAQSLAFLGEIDRHLGLLTEARDAFRAAVAKAPDDVALRHALERLEQQLGGVRER